MKFGVLQFFSWPGRRVPLETVYQRAFQRIEVMEKTGYDAVWLAEHHFGVNGRDNSPNPFMIATDLGSRTARIKMGLAVVILPL